MRNADLDGAAADFTKAIELKSNLPGAYFGLAECKRKKGDLDSAIEDYGAALQVTLASEQLQNVVKEIRAGIFYNRGVAKAAKGDFEGALADYDEAINLKNNSAVHYYNRGSARKKLGDLEGATGDFTKAIEIRPGYAAAYRGRASIRNSIGDAEGENEDLARAAEFTIKLDPSDELPGGFPLD